MSKDIWFFSDHHFSHENILRFKDKEGNLIRPGFSSVDEMDKFMIEQWNDSIKPGDLVWHLGDITFDHKKFADKILNQLHGKLRMCLGNHDDSKYLSQLGRVQKLVVTRRFDEYGFMASHYPLHTDSLWNHRRGHAVVCVHGHTHQNDSPEGLYLNVSVEKTGYKPIHLEDLILMVNQKLKEVEE